MRSRHRIPTIFNLSMVDVLCCALGCVILLWLLNFREAKQRSLAAGQTGVELARTRDQLGQVTSDLDELRRRLGRAQQEAYDALMAAEETRLQRDKAAARADSLTTERDLLQKDLVAARGQLADLGKTMLALQLKSAATDDLLRKKTQDEAELAKKLEVAQKRVTNLEGLMREKDTLATAAARTADDLAERLRDAELRARQLRALADQRKADLDLDLLGRTRELVATQRRVDELLVERQQMSDQVFRARAAATAAENRFAGITLTGRRVVFLVDMSGSMELVDEKTASADKWAGVRDALLRIMRSLPDLEKFQVVLFEVKTSYLLGGDDRWLDYDPASSAAAVSAAMTAVKPRGGTNMYAAFDTAFRFRPLGLDTIYLLSDGLPSVGEGLTPEAGKTLREGERVDILAKYVRKKLLGDWNRPQPGRPRVRVNTVGFFYESPDVGAFLWALARENDGSFVGMSKP